MLTFAPGDTQRTVSVPTLADGRDEYEETFLVRLDSVQGGGAEVDASAAQARARIVDTDPAPAIEVVPALGTEGEALGFRVDLVSDRASDRHLTLVWSTQDGTARAGSDYTAVVERTLTLAPGETQATLAVSTLDDAVREEEETFRVRVRYGSQSAPASEVEAVEAAGTIVDDDVPGRPGLPQGVVAEVRYVVDHRVSGQNPSRIDLSWTAPAGETAVTGYRVDVSADGGRTWRVLAPLVAGTSYAHEGLMPGETWHYRVRAVGAGGVEGLPAQVVQATTGGGIRRLEVTSRPAHGGVYRAGEEIVVTVRLADRWKFRARLPLLIGGRTRDAECREKTPFVGDINYPYLCPVEHSSEIELSYVVQAEDRDEDGISILADTLRGHLESTGASLVNPDQRLPHPGVGPLSGHEVDGRPLRVSVAGAPVVEEGEAAAFTVMLSEPAREPVTVVWSTVPDLSAHFAESAAPGTEPRRAFGDTEPALADYEPVAAAMLTFAPGDTQRTVSVPTLADGRDEYEETFLVRLDSVQGGGAEIDASAAQARARIVDTDPVPAIEVAPALGAEGEALEFRVDLVSERASARHLTLVWSTVDGTARAGSDYTAVVERTLTLAPGQTRATLVVPALDDAVREGAETFRVRVRYGSQSAPASEAEAVEAAGTIVDDGVPGRPGLPREVVAEVRFVDDHRVSGPDPSRIDLSWTAPAGETEVTGYRVDVSADGGRRWRVLAPLVAGTSYAHEGLMPGETRHYRVRAVGAGGVEGLPAQVVQATTGPGIRRLEVTSRPAHGGVYRAGEEIVVTVHLADRWRFYDPRLPLLIGGRTRDAECREKTPTGFIFYTYRCPGEPSSEIELSYVVVAEDRDEDGISVSADTLRGYLESANGGEVGFDQQLPHPGVGPLSGHKVDGGVRVSVAGAPVVEESEAAAFTVMLSAPAREPVTVVWSTVVDLSAHGLESAAPGTELRAATGDTESALADYEPGCGGHADLCPGRDAARGVGSDPGGWTRRVRGDVPGAAGLGAGGRRRDRRLGGAGEGADRRHRPGAGHRGGAGVRRGGRGAGVRGGSRVREALRPASDAGLVDGGRDGSGGVGLHRGGGADADPRTGRDAGDAGGVDPRRRGARGGGDVPGAGAVRVAVGAGIGGGGGRGRGDDRGRRRAGEAGLAPGGGRGGAVRR